MKTRIYLNDWFFNAGIVGFIRILNYNNKNFLIIKDNYIEFETSNLKDFHKCYFKYFFDLYNQAKNIESNLESSFSIIENIIEKCKNGELENEDKNKLKKEKDNIKNTLKGHIKKIEKIDKEKFNDIKSLNDEVVKITENEGIEKIEFLKASIIKILYDENINKITTVNYFKSILSNSFFFFYSFLNVSLNSLEKEQQEERMYIDYISNIIEEVVLNDIILEKYSTGELSKIIENKLNDGLVNEESKKIYKEINNKFIKKEKSEDEISEFLKTKLRNCSICGEEHFTFSNFTEANFIPMALSSDNAQNFFWNQNVKFPICDLCKLILFCIPAGVTSISKIVKKGKEKAGDKSDYKEEKIYSFVNLDTDINVLLNTNINFMNNSKKERSQYNPYSELILDIVNQNKHLSEWELQNIFVVEFEASYNDKYSRIHYFNIPNYVAKFFENYSYELNQVSNYQYKLQITSYILDNKDLTKVINDRLKESFQDMIQRNNYQSSENSFHALKIQCILNILKRSGIEMNEEIKKANGKLYKMYSLGNEIHYELKRNNNENKLDGYIYKMLNCIKTDNKKDFIDIAIRVIWSSGKDIPDILVKEDENIKWQELGHSFIAGLTSTKYNKENEEENVNE